MKKLHFIVNGEDVFVPSFREDTLGAAKRDALMMSRNTGRPAEDWQLRATTGALLDEGAPAAGHFGERMFLTLAVGAGG